MKTDRALKIHSVNEIFGKVFFIFFSRRGNNRLCASFPPSSHFCTVFIFPFRPNSAESVKKIVDKSSIKFIHAVKLDTKTGKTEDRVLVRCCSSF